MSSSKDWHDEITCQGFLFDDSRPYRVRFEGNGDKIDFGNVPARARIFIEVHSPQVQISAKYVDPRATIELKYFRNSTVRLLAQFEVISLLTEGRKIYNCHLLLSGDTSITLSDGRWHLNHRARSVNLKVQCEGYEKPLEIYGNGVITSLSGGGDLVVDSNANLDGQKIQFDGSIDFARPIENIHLEASRSVIFRSRVTDCAVTAERVEFHQGGTGISVTGNTIWADADLENVQYIEVTEKIEGASLSLRPDDNGSMPGRLISAPTVVLKGDLVLNEQIIYVKQIGGRR